MLIQPSGVTVKTDLARFSSAVNRFQPVENRYTGLRTTTRKYVKYNGGFEELFDLAADPHELKNEAGEASYADELAGFRTLQDRLQSCVGEGCWVP